MSYIDYILYSLACVFSAMVGEGNGEWLPGVIGLLTMAIIVAVFLLSAFLLNTRHNIMYAILITIGVVIIVIIFFIILESFIGPVELPSC